MLAKRVVTLTTSVVEEPILRREHLNDVRRAEDILAHARQQARRILDDAEREAGVRIEQVTEQFWADANTFLQGLQMEREAFHRDALNTVEQLLNEALARLLDATSLPERTRALLRDLESSQPIACVATLSCNPDLVATVEEWLRQSHFAQLWQVQRNSTLSTDTLILSHDSGAFEVEWNALCAGLTPPRA